jgi:glucokinase
MTTQQQSPIPQRCLAIDFGGSKVALALFEPNGAISARARFDIRVDMCADEVLVGCVNAGKELLNGDTDVLIGAVSPGVILEDRILLAPNVNGWSDVALRSELVSRFGNPRVRVGNDVKAAARAEAVYGSLQECDPGIYVNVGTGVAVAIVVGGTVISGAHGASGECGYNSAVFSEAQIAEGTTERTITLEEIVGARALLRGARIRGWPCETPQELFELSHTDSELKVYVDEAFRELATHLQHMVNFLDPQRICIGGGLVGSADSFLPLLQSRIRCSGGEGPDIVVATFQADASLFGARLIGVGL